MFGWSKVKPVFSLRSLRSLREVCFYLAKNAEIAEDESTHGNGFIANFSERSIGTGHKKLR